MADYTSGCITVYGVTDPKVQDAVLAVADEWGLDLDWGMTDSMDRSIFECQENQTMSYVKPEGEVTFTDPEMRVGAIEDIAKELVEAGVEYLDGHDDPKYEWLGTYVAYNPELGWFTAECDAEGNVVIRDHFLLSKVREATDLAELQEWIERSLGIPWRFSGSQSD